MVCPDTQYPSPTTAPSTTRSTTQPTTSMTNATSELDSRPKISLDSPLNPASTIINFQPILSNSIGDISALTSTGGLPMINSANLTGISSSGGEQKQEMSESQAIQKLTEKVCPGYKLRKLFYSFLKVKRIRLRNQRNELLKRVSFLTKVVQLSNASLGDLISQLWRARAIFRNYCIPAYSSDDSKSNFA